MKTYLPKKENIHKQWYHLNAEGKVLGRLATRCVQILRGKGKVYFMPSVDTGDFVVVTNVEKMKLTGRKLEQKVRFSHSGYPGGTKFIGYKKLMEEHPERVLYMAVKGMLPRNRLGARLLTKLKIYRGGGHPHAVQKPETV